MNKIMHKNKLETFLERFSASLANGTFVKAVVGNYKGADAQLQKVVLRKIGTRRGDRLQFTFRRTANDTFSNLAFEDAAGELRRLLGDGFRSGHLFTLEEDLQFESDGKGGDRLSASGPTFTEPPAVSHDRQKRTAVDVEARYLNELGITSRSGQVLKSGRAKFKQINHFIGMLEVLIEEASLRQSGRLEVADMAAGKGYLTFALYDHLANGLGIETRMTGVEERPELAAAGNAVAEACGFEGLSFVEGRIAETEIGDPDILIALHACDTATDDAIYRGILAGSRLIVAAPCCQKELRPQLRFPAPADPLNKFGLLLERTTESVTDGIRAVLLEHCGYAVKMLEFVSPEHTPKNNMIAAVLKSPGRNLREPSKKTREIMELFGIASQRLDSLLRGSAHG